MVAFTLESLVLRGISVLRDGQAVELRRGTSYAAVPTPEIVNSMRHPSPGCLAFNRPLTWQDPTLGDEDEAKATGAGRSLSRAGVPSRSPARIAGWAIRSRMSPNVGGPKPVAVGAVGLIRALPTASTGKTAPTANARLHTGLPAGTAAEQRFAAARAWQQPASAPRPSTRGKGAR
jgi:hypothetical protein